MFFAMTDSRPPQPQVATLRQWAQRSAFPYPLRGAMKRTGPTLKAFLISAKIRPGKRAPSVGVNAFTLTICFELTYFTARSSINWDRSIDGEKPVKTSLSDSLLALMSAMVLEFQPGERTS